MDRRDGVLFLLTVDLPPILDLVETVNLTLIDSEISKREVNSRTVIPWLYLTNKKYSRTKTYRTLRNVPDHTPKSPPESGEDLDNDKGGIKVVHNNGDTPLFDRFYRHTGGGSH